MKDSKKLWLGIDQKINPAPVTLGRYTSQAYIQDPLRMSFITARYKFCARLLKGYVNVIEIGCGDGFGSGMVAATVGQLVATDINDEMLRQNQARPGFGKNLCFAYHDFRSAPYPDKADAIYLIDTLEHIYPDEESLFLTNLSLSLQTHGVCLMGTPNKHADTYANNWSRAGHVNLKSAEELVALGKSRFHNVFFFGMNDEVVHTGFPDMAHFMWILCVGPRREAP